MIGAWVFAGEYTDIDGGTNLVVLMSSEARTSVLLGMLDFARALAIRDALDDDND